MKLLTEYLEHALTFERLAAGEKDPKLKAELEGRQPPIVNWRRIGRSNTGSRCQARAT
jgi:hypothetical protein